MKKLAFLMLMLGLVGCQSQDEKDARQIATQFVQDATRRMGRASTVPQHIEAFKNPGESTTIWLWGAPAQSSFDGISVESSTRLEGPYTDLPLSIAKTDVRLTFPAPSETTFYKPYFWKMVGGKKTRVASSLNLVEVSMSPPKPPEPIPPEPTPQGAAPVITAR
jgi:hypothetical protein